MKRTLLFVITQFYRGGAETALVNLLKALSPEDYDVDLLVLNQTTQENSLLPEVPAWVRVLDAASRAKRTVLRRASPDSCLQGIQTFEHGLSDQEADLEDFWKRDLTGIEDTEVRTGC